MYILMCVCAPDGNAYWRCRAWQWNYTAFCSNSCLNADCKPWASTWSAPIRIHYTASFRDLTRPSPPRTPASAKTASLPRIFTSTPWLLSPSGFSSPIPPSLRPAESQSSKLGFRRGMKRVWISLKMEGTEGMCRIRTGGTAGNCRWYCSFTAVGGWLGAVTPRRTICSAGE